MGKLAEPHCVRSTSVASVSWQPDSPRQCIVGEYLGNHGEIMRATLAEIRGMLDEFEEAYFVG
jgi:hypothetical protein